MEGTPNEFDSREEDIEKVRIELGNPIALENCLNTDYTVASAGIPLLCKDKQIYVDKKDSHTIIYGATGSKKTRNVIMPTVRLLGIASESMFLIDPKSELYDRTAYDLSQRGYEIVAINFRNPSFGNGWNPLEIPYKFYKRGLFDRSYEFVNDIVNNIMVDNVSSKDPYWDRTAADLLFGLILVLFDICNKHYHKGGMVDYHENERPCFNDNDVNFSSIIRLRANFFMNNSFENSLYWKNELKKNSLISISMIGTITAPKGKTQPSILSTFDQKMRFFMLQDNLTRMMSFNNFDLDSVGTSKSKHAFFIIMPDEKTTYHKLVSLFIKQSYEYLIYLAQQYSDKRFPRRVNYLLDEFASLPRIEDFPAMISAARSRNIRFNIVIQSESQLVQKYDKDAETIKSNCNNWLFLTSRELSLLKEIEALCGYHQRSTPLYSVARLQHLKKEYGEALLLSGRLFPFLTRLFDIDQYDGYDSRNKGLWKRMPMKEIPDLF